MGSKRQDDSQQQQEAPTFSGSDEVAMQNSMFGDMMKAQADNRQKQLAMRMNRLGQMGGGGLLGGIGQQANFQGILESIIAQQVAQRMPVQQQQPQQQLFYDNFQGA